MGRTTGLFEVGGRQTGSTDAMGFSTGEDFNPDDNPDGTTDALGNTTSQLLDALDQATVTVAPLGDRTTVLYDAGGRATVTIDALGLRKNPGVGGPPGRGGGPALSFLQPSFGR